MKQRELRKIKFDIEKRLSFLKGKKESVKYLINQKFKKSGIWIYFFIAFILMSGFICLGYYMHPAWLAVSLILMVPGSFVVVELLWHIHIPTRKTTKHDKVEIRKIEKNKDQIILNKLYEKNISDQIKKDYYNVYGINVAKYKDIISI